MCSISEYPDDYKAIFKDVLSTNLINYGFDDIDGIKKLSFLIDVSASLIGQAVSELNNHTENVCFDFMYLDLGYSDFLEDNDLFRYSQYSPRFIEYLKLAVYSLYSSDVDFCLSNLSLVENICDDLVFGIYSMSIERRANTLKKV